MSQLLLEIFSEEIPARMQGQAARDLERMARERLTEAALGFETLRAYAGLTRDCTVIGAGSRVEVWDTQAWNTYLESTEQGFADQSEEVIPGLL